MRLKQKNKQSDNGKTKDNLITGTIICAIQIVLSLIFIAALIKINILPESYLLGIAVVLILLGTASVLWQSRIKRGRLTVRTISGLLSIVLFISSGYIVKASNTLNNLDVLDIKLENMMVAVLADDAAEVITDTATYTFAIQEISEDEDYYGMIVSEIESQIDCTLVTVEYASLSEQITALENGEVDAIVYNEAYMSIEEEVNEAIVDEIKVIYEYGVEIELEIDVDEVEIDTEEDSNVFSVYISGIDTYGSISQTSRSDVNIIAIVNPDTEQILLVSTPRDYYVTLSGVSGESEDKLTHAGIYGVDVSVDTLEELYDMNIDYYVRVNFSSFTTIIDALGGIEVYSSQSFYTTEHDGVGIYVEEGYNDFTGLEALLFARERYNLDGGDYQRGENHEELIKAIIEKISSPSIITGAYEILDSIADCIDTDIPTEFLQELIKTQIDEGTEWEIVMVSADGMDGSAMCYSYSGGTLSVVYPDEDSVLEISELIDSIYDGEYIEVTEEEVVE